MQLIKRILYLSRPERKKFTFFMGWIFVRIGLCLFFWWNDVNTKRQSSFPIRISILSLSTYAGKIVGVSKEDDAIINDEVCHLQYSKKDRWWTFHRFDLSKSGVTDFELNWFWLEFLFKKAKRATSEISTRPACPYCCHLLG